MFINLENCDKNLRTPMMKYKSGVFHGRDNKLSSNSTGVSNIIDYDCSFEVCQ